jgi:superfamily I DNA and/or RNA helicase
VGKLLRFDAGKRLVNVAVTRARGKLVIIANKSWYKGQEYLKYINPLLWAVVCEE